MNPAGSNDKELRMIEIEFLEALEAGLSPTLEDFVRRYPAHTSGLTQFIVSAVLQDAKLKQNDACGNEVSEADLLAWLESHPIKATSFTDAIRQSGLTASEVGRQVRLPIEIITKLQRGELTGLPERLVSGLANTLRLPRQLMDELLQVASSQPRLSSSYRATGTPEVTRTENSSFEATMIDLRQRGKLSAEQIKEWMPE